MKTSEKINAIIKLLQTLDIEPTINNTRVLNVCYCLLLELLKESDPSSVKEDEEEKKEENQNGTESADDS